MAKRLLLVSYTADWTGPTNSLLLSLKSLRDRFDMAVLVSGEGHFTYQLARQDIPFFSMPTLGKKAIPAIYRLIRREQIGLVYGNRAGGESRNAFIATKSKS